MNFTGRDILKSRQNK